MNDPEANDPELLRRARALHDRVPVVDGHVDTILDVAAGRRQLGRRSRRGHVDLPRLREAGVSVQFFAHFVEPEYKPERSLGRLLQLLAAFFRACTAEGEGLRLLLSREDLAAVQRGPARADEARGGSGPESRIGPLRSRPAPVDPAPAGPGASRPASAGPGPANPVPAGPVQARTGQGLPSLRRLPLRRTLRYRRRPLWALLSVEGGEPLGTDLSRLLILHRLGVRSLGLVWNERNALADGVGDPDSRAGLTPFGRQVVREMNRLGMLVDVAHLNRAGVADVLAESRAPVVASHANAYALCLHPRNLTDEQLRDLAQAGGVVGVTFYPPFLVPDGETATLEHVLRHIDHIAAVAGIEHVGIGSDFDGIDDTPRGLEDVTALPRLTAGLLARGYSEAEVAAVLGGNFLRVLAEVLPPR